MKTHAFSVDVLHAVISWLRDQGFPPTDFELKEEPLGLLPKGEVTLWFRLGLYSSPEPPSLGSLRFAWKRGADFVWHLECELAGNIRKSSNQLHKQAVRDAMTRAFEAVRWFSKESK